MTEQQSNYDNLIMIVIILTEKYQSPIVH